MPNEYRKEDRLDIFEKLKPQRSFIGDLTHSKCSSPIHARTHTVTCVPKLKTEIKRKP